MAQSVEFQDIVKWLEIEREYQVKKWGDYESNLDAEHVAEGAGDDSWLYQQVLNYMNRLRLFPLGSPQWMQAYMKLIATLVGLGEASIRLWGLPPVPGVSSGEIREWV